MKYVYIRDTSRAQYEFPYRRLCIKLIIYRSSIIHYLMSVNIFYRCKTNIHLIKFWNYVYVLYLCGLYVYDFKFL